MELVDQKKTVNRNSIVQYADTARRRRRRRVIVYSEDDGRAFAVHDGSVVAGRRAHSPQEQKQERRADENRGRRRLTRRPVGNVAQRRLATRLARVDLDPLTDHDTPVLALARTVPFQGPQLLSGRGALVARRVRVPFHLFDTICFTVSFAVENRFRPSCNGRLLRFFFNDPKTIISAILTTTKHSF